MSPAWPPAARIERASRWLVQTTTDRADHEHSKNQSVRGTVEHARDATAAATLIQHLGAMIAAASAARSFPPRVRLIARPLRQVSPVHIGEHLGLLSGDVSLLLGIVA